MPGQIDSFNDINSYPDSSHLAWKNNGVEHSWW
jgi:hypothetical protein